MAITYNGTILHDQQLNTIITECERHNIDARFAIVQAYFETRWGTVGAGKTNNNWAGITWVKNYKGNPDAKKSKGGNRPADEGGNYVLYPTADDGIKDWIYLLRPGNLYNVAGSRTISDYVKGLFKNGGNAKADYAGSGYAHYLENMTEIYNGMKGLLKDLGGNTMGVTAQQFVNEALKLVGTKHGSSAYNQLVKDYNGNLSKVIAGGGLNPAPRNVGLSTDMSSGMYDWCAGFVSVVAVRLGITNIIGCEIAAERLGRQQHQSKGTWKGKVKPQVGDLVIFKWTNPTPGSWADHIGIVWKVDSNTFWVVEGNVGSPRSVSASRSFSYLDARVLGFARPKFAIVSTSTKTVEEVAKEVIAGKWGNGEARKTQIVNAGYDYAKVQVKVNELTSVKEETKPSLKNVETIAKEVIAGKWSTGDARKAELTKAGYDYQKVQQAVNSLLAPDLTAVARDVIAGKYGNGQSRVDKLKAKGFNPQSVQSKVNELL